MSSIDFRKISSNDSTDATVVLRWLGTTGDPHPDIVAFLVQQGTEVRHFDRKGDSRLQEPRGIETYCREIREGVAALVSSGKRVHLVGISFGGFLSLKVALEMRSFVDSIVAIAPVIDPHGVLSALSETDESSTGITHAKLANGLRLPISLENIKSVQGWIPENLSQPTIAIIGSDDGLENPENLDRITGQDVSKHVLSGVRHCETTGHCETRRLLARFYGRILG